MLVVSGEEKKKKKKKKKREKERKKKKKKPARDRIGPDESTCPRLHRPLRQRTNQRRGICVPVSEGLDVVSGEEHNIIAVAVISTGEWNMNE